jgi:16S rRNA (cytosine967-C5)-methyltransferase
MSRANPGRVAALRALTDVEDGGHAEDLLAAYAPKNGQDRALSWHLVLGTLRWQGSLDHALEPYVKRGLSSLDAPVRNALRMGLFEAQKCRTPARAAVHQAVECIKAIGLRRASGMVNAVLRRASNNTLSEDPIHTLPGWLAERWGEHRAWTERIREPALVSIAGRLPSGLELPPARFGDSALSDIWTLPGGAGQISALPGFDEGDFWVMDPAAARVADTVQAEVPSGGTVLDACAAPGGKTFRLARAGLKVTAVDESDPRIERMRESLERLQIDVAMQVHDWTTGPLDDHSTFDAVLVDAPCTALGVVRRHPEILWRRRAGDPAAMSITQRIILKQAAKHVKEGGALIYAVCSTEPEEGSAVVKAMSGWTVTQQWSSIPPRGDEDGFQAFVLRRDED